MKYSPKYFYDSMPEWKRKKDNFIVRFIYRPISFLVSSVCANLGITANEVSYFSLLVGVLAGVLFLFGRWSTNLVAAILLNIWSILDCVDGNLARSVKKQPFGEFADAVSGYVLTSTACFGMGYSAYKTGSAFFTNDVIVILLGGFAAFGNPLMRLIYHKYKKTLSELAGDEGLYFDDKDNHGDHSQVRSIKTQIEETIGFGGILPAIVLLAVIFNFLDLAVLYCALSYGGACIVMSSSYIRKAIKNEKIVK